MKRSKLLSKQLPLYCACGALMRWVAKLGWNCAKCGPLWK